MPVSLLWAVNAGRDFDRMFEPHELSEEHLWDLTLPLADEVSSEAAAADPQTLNAPEVSRPIAGHRLDNKGRCNAPWLGAIKASAMQAQRQGNGLLLGGHKQQRGQDGLSRRNGRFAKQLWAVYPTQKNF